MRYLWHDRNTQVLPVVLLRNEKCRLSVRMIRG